MEELLGSMFPCPRVVRGQQRLTAEQEEYARQFAQERIAKMLATTPIDEQEAEMHLREAYRMIGREPPATIRWFDSPVAFLRACVRGDSVWEWEDVFRRLERSLWEGVRGRVEGSVRASAWEIVAEILDSVQTNVGHSLWESVAAKWESMYDMASVRAYSSACWLAFCWFLHEVFEENELIHLALFNEMVSGYRLESKEAWLVRKPIMLEHDEQGRLHSASGRCLQFRDGWGFYAWHGVRVSKKLILHPEQITRKDWMKAENVEVRRVIQERLGNDRFVEVVGGTSIDEGKRGKLIEIDLFDDPEWVARYVQVQDASTRRQYFLRVPPSISRADEAVAWTFGLDEQDYQPRQET